MEKTDMRYLYQSLVDEHGFSREKIFFNLEEARSLAVQRGGVITPLYLTGRGYEAREDEQPEIYAGPDALLCPCGTEIELSCPSDELCWACLDGLEHR